MYLMYVDESGDPGVSLGSPTKYFVLSGLIIHELRWESTLNALIDFRRHLRATKGLKLREEIHASAMITRPGSLRRIAKHDRLDILRQCIDFAANTPDLNIISVVTDKAGKTTDQVFELSWQALIQRFENTISFKNFQGPSNSDERGILIPDNTAGLTLTKILRKMRRYNPIPNTRTLYTGGSRNLALQYVIEDPIMRDSKHSYFHQLIDVIAYMAKQKYDPNAYMRRKGGRNYYSRLLPSIVTQASPSNPLGIVRL